MIFTHRLEQKMALIGNRNFTCLHGVRPRHSSPSGFPVAASSWCNPYSEPPSQHKDQLCYHDVYEDEDYYEGEGSLLQSCCHLCWVPKNSFACRDQTINIMTTVTMMMTFKMMIYKKKIRSVALTWPGWGNPMTQDWHCQPAHGKSSASYNSASSDSA